MTEQQHHPIHRLEKSAIITVISIILLFSFSVIVVLIAPSYVDPTWTSPTTPYQVQMYEVSDPNFYIGKSQSGSSELSFVYRLQDGYTLMAFHETAAMKIVAPTEMEKFVTRHGDKTLKLTSRLLMLRHPEKPQDVAAFDAVAVAEKVAQESLAQWEKENPNWKEQKQPKPKFEVLELYAPGGKEAFAVAPSDTVLENWVDKDYTILDASSQHPYHQSTGVIFVNNPREYRVTHYAFGNIDEWRYDPNGEKIKDLSTLLSHPLGFRSRKELITTGEHLFAVEGCWYCHTDQTRTLVQDVVLNGSAEFPAPPSSANEYIYQKITFPGTKRNGPDISRVGVKRPSRDWHKGHFWSPKTASLGSIMPSFRHFFDNDPRGTSPTQIGIPNYKFEAIFQYLMTKGTRITPPTEAWWLGKDPIDTKAIIEGRKRIQ